MLTAKHNTVPRWPALIYACLLYCTPWGFQPLWAQTKPVDETQIVATDEPQGAVQPDAPAKSSTTNDKTRLAQQRRRLLAELKGPPEAVWIEVDGEKLLAFWHPDQSGKPLGALVLLHAPGQNPRWADLLLRLHEYLPLHGWATLSIELPELPGHAIPDRKPLVPASNTAPEPQATQTAAVDESQVVHQEADEPATATETPANPVPTPVDSIAEVRAGIQRRITAATQYLHQQGQYNLVLLGEGAGAFWALEHLEQAVAPAAPTSTDATRKGIVERAIRALIMVDLQIPEPLVAKTSGGLLRHPQVPTLDLYTDWSPAARDAAAGRKQEAVKAAYETYIQKRLPPAAGVLDSKRETTLTKTLRGFLQQHAQGEKLN